MSTRMDNLPLQTSVIPPFDHNGVLPPHLGDPRLLEQISPYKCTTVELCERFATTPERIRLLEQLLTFRATMSQFHIVNGFQWIDGSFTENIEVLEKRAPNDIDVVTFYWGLAPDHETEIKNTFYSFLSPKTSKEVFSLDHYHFPIDANPIYTVNLTFYWYQLFSHTRNSIWKGMIQLELNTPDFDIEALNILKARSSHEN
jgi:hypothetical protein